MKNNFGAFAIVSVLSVLACQPAMSAPFTPTYSERHQTRAYVGFQWFTGETSLTKPNVVLGLQRTTTDVSNKVTGFDISYAYSLEKSKSDAFRLGYLDGKCSRGLATAGVGYSFKKDAVLGFAGLATSHAKVFGEIDGSKNLGAALELNTLSCAGDRRSTAEPIFNPG